MTNSRVSLPDYTNYSPHYEATSSRIKVRASALVVAVFSKTFFITLTLLYEVSYSRLPVKVAFFDLTFDNCTSLAYIVFITQCVYFPYDHH
jgi:hypothetical protein